MPALKKEIEGDRHVRSFVAFPFPKGLWKEAEKVRMNNSEVANLRWSPLQNLHVTIFFLGEIYTSKLDEIKDAIKNEVWASSPFKPEFEKISLEKGKRHSGMIWIRFFKHEVFTSLSLRLHKSLEEFLLNPVKTHDSIAHITIARWKGDLKMEEINTEFDADFLFPEINYLELWQSVNTPTGVRYDSLERFEMKLKTKD